MLSREQLLAELVLERFGPAPLPPPKPPHPVEQALAERATAPDRPDRPGRRLVVLPGGGDRSAA